MYTACTCLRSSVEMVGIFLSGAFCHTRSKMLRMNHQCLFMTRTMTVRKIIMPQLADGSSPMECSALRRAWSQRVRQVRCCERGPNACATQRAGCMPYYTGSVKVSATTCFPTAAGAASSKSPVRIWAASTCVRNLTSAGRSSILTEESSRSAPSMTPAECRCTHVWMRTRASMGTGKFLGAEAQIRKDVKNRHRELARLQARVCLHAGVCVHASRQI